MCGGIGCDGQLISTNGIGGIVVVGGYSADGVVNLMLADIKMIGRTVRSGISSETGFAAYAGSNVDDAVFGAVVMAKRFSLVSEESRRSGGSERVGTALRPRITVEI